MNNEIDIDWVLCDNCEMYATEYITITWPNTEYICEKCSEHYRKCDSCWERNEPDAMMVRDEWPDICLFCVE